MEIFELHYHLLNGSHSMDAFVKNRAEKELLKAFKEFAQLCSEDFTIEVKALEEGGIREFFKVITKKKNLKKAAIVVAFFGVIFQNVISDIIADKFIEDTELVKLQKEELRLHIKKLKRDLGESDNQVAKDKIIQNIIINVYINDKIKFHRSKFYQELLKEPKITKITTQVWNEKNKPLSPEKTVERDDFHKFIHQQIDLEPEINESTNIEIVSPVLKQGNIKWKGIDNGTYINFNLKDSDFKNDVLNRKISFTNGTAIKCTTEYLKTMDDEGEVKTKEINVYDVVEVYQGTSFVPTKKGKEIAENKKQLKIKFDGE